MDNFKTLKVKVTERQTKDGRKFNTYTTYSKNGRRTELKFRKAITAPPTKDCYIVVDVNDISLDESREYPVVWIGAIQDVLDVTEVNAERSRDRVNEYFG